MFTRSLLASVVLALTACGPQGTEINGSDDVTGDETNALTTTELKATTTGITVWLRPYAVKSPRSGTTYWVVRGRTSVNLESAMSFVPDDAFCETTLLGARTFEIAIHPASETNTLLSGLPLFVNLNQPGGKHAIAKFVLEPRFVDATGTTRLWLNTELKPIYVSGVGLTYRGKVSGTGAVSGVIGGTPAKLTRRAGINDFNIDVGFDQLSNGALFTGAEFKLDLEGVPYVKKATVAFGVKDLEISRTDDAYAFWPSATCTAAIQACLNTAGADAFDYESCGTYRQVSRCNIPSSLPQLGLSPDDRAQLDGVLAQINAALPVTKHVTVNGFYVQSSSGGRPTIAQAVKAWQQLEQTPTALEGERTAGQLNLDLDAYTARPVVPSIQKVVFQQSFKVMRLRSAHTTWEALYFSTAARLMVIRLVDDAS